LSGRTSLQHRRGLVAMCPRRNADGSPRVLVYQEALPPQVRWGAEPAGATSIATTQPAFADPVNATASVAPAPSEFPDDGGPYDDSGGATRRYATATCGDTTLSCDPAIVLTGFTNPDAPAYQGSISNVRLWLRGQPSSNVSAP